jgi:hypothetical protein
MITIKKSLLTLLSIMFMLNCINSTISIYNAQSLNLDVEKLGLLNVNFSIANFGFVP